MASKAESLADRLKTVRQKLGMTQAEMANAAGIPLPTWKKYEAATREPGTSALTAMAVTGVDLHWLLTGQGPVMRQGTVQDQAYAAGSTSVLEVREGGGPAMDAALLAAAVAGVDNVERAGGGRLDPGRKTAMILSLYQSALTAKASA